MEQDRKQLEMKDKSDEHSDNSSLPPIFRLGSSESDTRDEDKFEISRKDKKHGITEATIRFPTIDMTRTNSVASFMSTPNSRTRQSRERNRLIQRNGMCKSPSCPADLGPTRRKSIDLESPTLSDKTILNASPTHEDKENDDIKLPSIYRNVNSLSLPIERQTYNGNWQLNGLRRTESCKNPYDIARDMFNTSPTHDAKTSPRSKTHAALLLPLRNTDNSVSNKSKKNNKKKVKNSYHEVDKNNTSDYNTGANTWESEYDVEMYNSARSSNFDKIAEETDSASHLKGSRKMKPWLKDRAQKEGQVKA